MLLLVFAAACTVWAATRAAAGAVLAAAGAAFAVAGVGFIVVAGNCCCRMRFLLQQAPCCQ